MKAVKLLCVVLIIGAVHPALACDVPGLVRIPDDESAGANSTTLVQLETIRYLSAMSSYVECLRNLHEAASADDAPDLHLSLLARRNNLAVAEIETVQTAYAASVGPIDELAEIESAECIDARSGLRDVILDDRTIVFYTRGGEPFLNVLSQSCPILRANNSTLSYSVTKSARFVEELCSGNPVSDATTPASARRCLLGLFFPISEGEAQELRGR